MPRTSGHGLAPSARRPRSEPSLGREENYPGERRQLVRVLRYGGDRFVSKRLNRDISMPPTISIVIPTRNRATHLAECLEAVRVAAADRDVQVLVMDQSDTEDSLKVVEALQDGRFQYHRMPRPGACPARNFGAAIAQAPLVAFLDDDCCPQPTWIERILMAFERDSTLQFIFGQLKAPPGAENQNGSYPEFLPSTDWQRQRGRRRVAMVSAGANMIARKEFLCRIGGFDELLGPNRPTVKSNDSSLSYKVFASGAKWIADPDIEVIHTNGFRSHSDALRLFVEYDHGLGVNWGRFVRRGDLRAAGYFALEHGEMTWKLLAQIVRLERPRGIRHWAAHLKGFYDGLRLPGDVGHVDGSKLRRMGETGKLDA